VAACVGLIANTERKAALTCARELIDWLRAQDVAVRLLPVAAARLDLPDLAATDADLAACDFLVALGGDGTLLAASRIATNCGLRIADCGLGKDGDTGLEGVPSSYNPQSAIRNPQSPPILGIHCGGPGSFGFLMETTPARAKEALTRALAGEYNIDERMMVAAEVLRDGEVVGRFAALNEVVIKAAFARMLKMRITVSDTYIATYAADGIILATPTGSTAYNLASNGPLVHPTVPLIILTPICPHTLNVRSLIIGADEQARIGLSGDTRTTAHLTVDSQVNFDLRPGDTVLCHRAEVATRLMVFHGNSFYQKLQTRLRLGERFDTDTTDARTTLNP
jgi:NAD+ kinase